MNNAMKNNHILILITCKDKEESLTITNSLLKKKLAACVNQFPVESKFLWKGKVTSSKEYTLLIKTRDTLYKKVETEIKRLHSYENPEVLAINITTGSRDYLNWIDEVTEDTKIA